MPNYLTPLRRIAEAVSARLSYDFLCFKGPLFDEAYLSHSVSDVICSFYDPNTVAIRKGFIHPSLSPHTKPTGRKPEIDYVGLVFSNNSIDLAIEAKWAGSSHCTAANILWDLIRLKLIKDQYPDATCGLLIAGHKTEAKKVFSHRLFKPGTQHPLRLDGNKLKTFNLVTNLDHQPFINKQISEWQTDYPNLLIPNSVQTQLQESSVSAHPSARYVARCWLVQ